MSFTLNSTGTWCVMMKPVETYGFAADELGKLIFFNSSAFAAPVKTAIFMGGQEFQAWSEILHKAHNRRDIPPYDEARYRALLKNGESFLLPELLSGCGLFPGSRARVVDGGNVFPYEDILRGNLPPSFRDYEQGFALLQTSLAMQTWSALEMLGVDERETIITEGGFRKNDSYNRLLSSAFAHRKVCRTDLPEATALGAAMTALAAVSGKTVAQMSGAFEVSYREVAKDDLPELVPYRAKWLALVNKK
jgi:ribulose kinase